MIQNIKSIYSYFIFAGIFIFIISIIFFLATKKYSKKRVKFFALLSSLDKRSIILVSTFILNFTEVTYFSIATFNYNNFAMYLIIFTSLVSIIVSLNPHVIFGNTVYTAISIFSLKIINLVYNYLSFVYYDRLTFILGVIFVLMVIIYELFITIRQIEIVVKNVKPLGGVKNAGKSRKK